MSQSHEQMQQMFQYVTRCNNQDSNRFLKQHGWDLRQAFKSYFGGNDLINDSGGLTNTLASLDIRIQNDHHYAELYENNLRTSNNDPAIVDKQMANVRIMGEHKRIAFAAHNEKKLELIQCLKKHREVLLQHKLYDTGTTGSLVQKELRIPVTQYFSGPLGGDQQLGARIALGELDILIFIVDPLNCQAHEADVEALIRLSRVYNIVCATTTTDVDFILTSEMITKPHTREVHLVAYPNAKKAT